jgi:hypothetical protein
MGTQQNITRLEQFVFKGSDIIVIVPVWNILGWIVQNQSQYLLLPHAIYI